MASRLGPAKPRGIGCDGAGGSVIASQSRQENFSHTCSMIFQRRGSHSSVLVTTSASARRGLDDPFDRQIVRQLARPTWRAGTSFFGGLGRGTLGLRLRNGLRLLEILNGELELLDELLAALKAMGAGSVRSLEGVREEVVFPMPKGLGRVAA